MRCSTGGRHTSKLSADHGENIRLKLGFLNKCSAHAILHRADDNAIPCKTTFTCVVNNKVTFMKLINC